MSCSKQVEYGKLINVLQEQDEKMLGELLTFIDAILPPGKQVEATKSNVKQIVWRYNRAVQSSIDEITTSTKES